MSGRPMALKTRLAIESALAESAIQRPLLVRYVLRGEVRVDWFPLRP